MQRVDALLVALGALCFTATCCSAVYTDCGSKVGKFTQVRVSGCDEQQRACQLHRGTNVSFAIDFIADKDVSKMTAVVHGVILDVEMPFPLPYPDVCTAPGSGVTCPLKANTPYQYQTALPVDKGYPKISLKVKWELVDENNEDVVCVYIPVEIK